MKKTLVPGIIFMALLIGAGWFVWHKNTAGKNVQNDIAPAAGTQNPAVSVLKLEAETISMEQTLPGRVSALRQSQVRPQVNGIIIKRLFEEGATVEKGQQLYQIDAARYDAALLSAGADLKSALSLINSIEAKTGRYEDLVKIDAVSRQEYEDVKAQRDQANAAVAIAQAAVKVAQVNLDYTKVYAPISGRIGRSLVTEGALVTASQEQPMAIITQLDPVYVDIQQSGNDAMSLQTQIGSKNVVSVRILMGDDNTLSYPHEGTLKFSEVTIDETTGSINLRAIVPNPDAVLLPGLFVRAILTTGEQEVLLLPQRATTRTPDGDLMVWVINQDNKAHPRPIQATATYKDNWIVSDGLLAGDTVIIEGYQKIKPDTVISPVEWNHSPPPVPENQNHGQKE